MLSRVFPALDILANGVKEGRKEGECEWTSFGSRLH